MPKPASIDENNYGSWLKTAVFAAHFDSRIHRALDGNNPSLIKASTFNGTKEHTWTFLDQRMRPLSSRLKLTDGPNQVEPVLSEIERSGCTQFRAEVSLV